MTALGKRVRDLRKKRGVSQKELARRVKRDQSTLFRLEKGDSERPRTETIARIAEALRCTTDWLINGGESVDRAPAEELPSKPPVPWLVVEFLRLGRCRPVTRDEIALLSEHCARAKTPDQLEVWLRVHRLKDSQTKELLVALRRHAPARESGVTKRARRRH